MIPDSGGDMCFFFVFENLSLFDEMQNAHGRLSINIPFFVVVVLVLLII